MNITSTLFRLFLPILVTFSVSAQTEMSVFTATGRGGVATTFVDDYQAIGINPSNLGWSKDYSGKRIAFSIFEGGISLYSEALTRRDLIASMMGFGSTQLSQEEKAAAAVSFTSNDFATNVDFSLFAFSAKLGKAGGFAFSIRDRIQWFSKFSQSASEIMFMGRLAPYFDMLLLDDGSQVANTEANRQTYETNIVSGITTTPQPFSAVFDGSDIRLSWMREFNFSYGITLINNESYNISFGAGIKYVQGIATTRILASGGSLEASSAISPGFGIDYGAAADTNPSALPSSGFPPKGVGSGMGYDIGVSAIVKEKLILGFSVNDIGNITWDGNVYKGSDSDLTDLSSSGFDNYNFFTQAQNITGDNGLLQWSGESETTESLPTVARIGSSYKISEKIEVGADLVIPMNDATGNYERTMFGLGGDFKPVKALTLSSGFNTGGNSNFNVPFGITVGVAKNIWEVGVATRDIITWFAGDKPTVSASFGFLRFRI